MKIKNFIFLFIFCALILFSVVATESFKDENKVGAIEESKTKIRTDGWKWEDLGNWGGWGLGENGGQGDKEGGQGGGAHGESQQSVSGNGKDKNGKWEDLGNWGGWGLGENRDGGHKERQQGGESAQREGGTRKDRKDHRSRFSNGDSINLRSFRNENGGRRRRP